MLTPTIEVDAPMSEFFSKSPSSEFASLQRRISPYVEGDRARFVHGVSLDELATGTVFDFQHQTILRLWSMADEGWFAGMERYIEDLDFRRNVLVGLRSIYRLSPKAKMFERALPKAGMRFTAPDYERLVGELGRDMNAPDEDEFCYFVNSSGIALFRNRHCELFHFDDDVMETSQELSSTGAGMYYAFNTSSSRAYLQSSSIDVLAASISALRGARWASQVPQQSHIERSLGLYPAQNGDRRGMSTAFMTMFGMHELGHRVEHAGNGYLLQLLEDVGMRGDLVYRVGFPTSHDLRSWRRIRDGEGQVKDVLFVLGDTLANVAFLQTKPRAEVVGALRIFLSWLIKEPKLSSCPRGNAPLLLALIEDSLDALLIDIESLVTSCASHPEGIAEALLDFERTAWVRLGST